MSRDENAALADGLTIEYAGERHKFYRIDVEDPEKPNRNMVCYEIVRESDGEWIGRVSQYVKQERVIALIRRRYEPEEERIRPFTFGCEIVETKKTRRDPVTKKPKPNTPPVWHVTIPYAYVQRYDIRVDDEVKVHIGDTEPDSEEYELYHVSKQGKSCIIVLSKLWRTKGCRTPDPEASENDGGEDPPENDPYTFRGGEYRTVRIEPHRSKRGHWDLCYWYSRARADKSGSIRFRSETWDLERDRPKDPERPEPLGEAQTNFNDWRCCGESSAAAERRRCLRKPPGEKEPRPIVSETIDRGSGEAGNAAYQYNLGPVLKQPNRPPPWFPSVLRSPRSLRRPGTPQTPQRGAK